MQLWAELLCLQDPIIREIAKKRDRIAQEVIIRWGVQHGTSVLVKSGTPKHIKVSCLVHHAGSCHNAAAWHAMPSITAIHAQSPTLHPNAA